MFRIDFIPHKIIPVSGFVELSSANEKYIQGQDDVINTHFQFINHFSRFGTLLCSVAVEL